MLLAEFDFSKLFEGNSLILVLLVVFMFKDQVGTLLKKLFVPAPTPTPAPVPVPSPTPVPAPVPGPVERPLVDLISQLLPTLLPLILDVIQKRVVEAKQQAAEKPQ